MESVQPKAVSQRTIKRKGTCNGEKKSCISETTSEQVQHVPGIGGSTADSGGGIGEEHGTAG